LRSDAAIKKEVEVAPTQINKPISEGVEVK